MEIPFKPIEAEDIKDLTPLFCQRPNKTCDSVALDSFLWRRYYHVQFAVRDGKAIQWLMEENGVVINQISDADAWADAMQPIYDEYLASADERVVAFVEAVQALKAAE